MADEEKGARWWIRYAIVPLLAGGGGVIVAFGSFVYTKFHSPAPPASTGTGKNSGTVPPLPISDQSKFSSSPVLSPEKLAQRKANSNISPPHLTEPARIGQAVDVIIWHPRDLSSDALLIDGKKPRDGVIVDGGEGSPSTTLKLMPGQYRLSANLGGKICFRAFSVPASERVVLRCED